MSEERCIALRAARLKLGYTQEQMAARLRLNPQYYCGLEKGRRNICDLLQHRIDIVLRGEEAFGRGKSESASETKGEVELVLRLSKYLLGEGISKAELDRICADVATDEVLPASWREAVLGLLRTKRAALPYPRGAIGSAQMNDAPDQRRGAETQRREGTGGKWKIGN